MKTIFLAMVLVGCSVAQLFAADSPLVQVDREKRVVRVTAEATKRVERAGKVWPIEVFLCGLGGKMHEAVFHTTAKPSEIHKALEAIGLKPGAPADEDENGKYIAPRGDPVDVFVEWTDEQGKVQRQPSYKMLVYGAGSSDPRKSTQRGELKEPTPFTWLFVGSKMGIDPDTGKDVYGGDLNLSIAIVNHEDRTAVFQTTLKDEPGFIYETSPEVPSPGTKVSIILQPAK